METRTVEFTPGPMNWRPLDLDEAIPPWFSRGGVVLISGADAPCLVGNNESSVWTTSGGGPLPEEVKTYSDLAAYAKTVGIGVTLTDKSFTFTAPKDTGPMVCVWEVALHGERNFRENFWHPVIPGNELPRGNANGDALMLRAHRKDWSHSIGMLSTVWFAPGYEPNRGPAWFGRVDGELRRISVWEDLLPKDHHVGEEGPTTPPVSTWEFRFVSAVP